MQSFSPESSSSSSRAQGVPAEAAGTAQPGRFSGWKVFRVAGVMSRRTAWEGEPRECAGPFFRQGPGGKCVGNVCVLALNPHLRLHSDFESGGNWAAQNRPLRGCSPPGFLKSQSLYSSIRSIRKASKPQMPRAQPRPTLAPEPRVSVLDNSLGDSEAKPGLGQYSRAYIYLTHCFVPEWVGVGVGVECIHRSIFLPASVTQKKQLLFHMHQTDRLGVALEYPQRRERGVFSLRVPLGSELPLSCGSCRGTSKCGCSWSGRSRMATAWTRDAASHSSAQGRHC